MRTLVHPAANGSNEPKEDIIKGYHNPRTRTGSRTNNLGKTRS